MIHIRDLGTQPYLEVWEAMKNFTTSRQPDSDDELWLIEHPPVFTQGQAGKPEHILQVADIPIIQSDRGGQVTYHGPGQLVVYTLLDIKRRNIGIRTLVSLLEASLIACLDRFGIQGETRCKAPGVYVDERKIASIGLRVKNGCTYHGVALNVNMDLKPFTLINPCGFHSLAMTQVCEWTDVSMTDIKKAFIEEFLLRIDNPGAHVSSCSNA